MKHKPRERRPQASPAERQERQLRQQIEGRAAMAEYEKEQRAALDRMAKLKQARLEREKPGPKENVPRVDSRRD
jgi:hypothetical protein